MEENIFINYYQKTKENLNKYINQFNDEFLEKEKNPFLKENIKLFTDLNSDGKLIRGTLVNLGYKMVKEDSTYSYPLAMAFEVFQTSILIHDDLIDNDDLRRGKITVHAYNYNKYYELTKSSKSKKLAENLAICMGDLGLYKANQIISLNYKNDSNIGEILNYFNEVVINTIRGETLDVVLPFHEEYSLENHNLEENILEIYKLKTAYYTIVGPISLGMILGGSTKEKLESIEKFGYYAGVAFQLQDDLLGIYGDNIGKNIGSDIEEFKQTFLYAYTKTNKKYYKQLLTVYGREVDEQNIRKVQEIFKDSGAYDATVAKIEEFYDKAREIVENIDWLKEEDKKILILFIEYLKSRKK